jgi:hypothetical protein
LLDRARAIVNAHSLSTSDLAGIQIMSMVLRL